MVATAPSSPPEQAVNRVVLVGRLGTTVTRRDLPSGDALVAFTVVVDRPARRGQPSRVDAIACQTTRPAVAERVERWGPGAWVRVEGALQRRFWRGGSGLASATEVAVATVGRVPR
jgi:single-strand DNA-binding protein